MPAPPFFQSAGRRDLVVCGEKRRTDGNNMGKPIRTRGKKLAGKGKHNAGEPNRTTKGKLESWLEKAGTMHDYVVWCKSKKGAEEMRSFELSGKL